jgi:hypothetical protein
MNCWADNCVAQMLETMQAMTMQAMTLQDYGHVMIALVLVGWAITRIK